VGVDVDIVLSRGPLLDNLTKKLNGLKKKSRKSEEVLRLRGIHYSMITPNRKISLDIYAHKATNIPWFGIHSKMDVAARNARGRLCVTRMLKAFLLPKGMNC
jgi:hypothetical protein